MRVEPYSMGSFVHAIKRGARGMDIAPDNSDKWRFVKSLYILNDEHQSVNWHKETRSLQLFKRPAHWPEREPLVAILAWTLMPNHFHLLLQEIKEGGITKFMQRLCGSMSLCFNAKYGGQGSMFQGSYKGKTITNEAYLRHVLFYIVVKNTLELYPGGIKKAVNEFEDAWKWSLEYKFSSLRTCALGESSPIISESTFDEAGLNMSPEEFKNEARDMLFRYVKENVNT